MTWKQLARLAGKRRWKTTKKRTGLFRCLFCSRTWKRHSIPARCGSTSCALPSYKSASHLNEALCEYRTAMTLAQSGPIAQQALAGLRELRVIPPDDADMQGQPHEYELVHHGQGYAAGTD